MALRLAKPKRYDPTRTGLLRRQFESDLNRRFKQLEQEVYDLIAKENVFGMVEGQVVNARWNFRSAIDAIRQFKEWLISRSDKLVLQDDPKAEDRGKWIGTHITRAYFRGADQATNYLKKKPEDAGASSLFGRALRTPVNLKKVELVKARAFDELKGVTQAMSVQLGNTLADGLVRGENPLKVARNMTAQIETLNKNRARTIARTEMIRAHAEGSLDAMKQLGVTRVGVDVEWSATMIDPDKGIFEEKVCPKCQAMAGLVIPIEQASGLIPRHPNCRCAFIPNVLGTSPDKEIRSRIFSSIMAGASKKKKQLSKSEVLKQEPWAGADLV
jgi:SPP1 gp7 family putative phage head morphogenesis protein